MSSQHIRPLVAFLVVSAVCAMVLVRGLRADGLGEFVPQVPALATGAHHSTSSTPPTALPGAASGPASTGAATAARASRVVLSHLRPATRAGASVVPDVPAVDHAQRAISTHRTASRSTPVTVEPPHRRVSYGHVGTYPLLPTPPATDAGHTQRHERHLAKVRHAHRVAKARHDREVARRIARAKRAHEREKARHVQKIVQARHTRQVDETPGPEPAAPVAPSSPTTAAPTDPTVTQ